MDGISQKSDERVKEEVMHLKLTGEDVENLYAAKEYYDWITSKNQSRQDVIRFALARIAEEQKRAAKSSPISET